MVLGLALDFADVRHDGHGVGTAHFFVELAFDVELHGWGQFHASFLCGVFGADGVADGEEGVRVAELLRVVRKVGCKLLRLSTAVFVECDDENVSLALGGCKVLRTADVHRLDLDAATHSDGLLGHRSGR